MSALTPGRQAQIVVEGHAAAVAFIESLHTSSPTGDELLQVLKNHSYAIDERHRLHLSGFVRQLQKSLVQAAQLKGPTQ